MEFWKMNGNGNDFLMVLGSDYPGAPWEMIARRFCHRKKGVGADGLIILTSCEGACFFMQLYNADGSKGEMCGNGARCAARFAYEQGLAPRKMTFETPAGLIGAEVEGEQVTLQMSPLLWHRDWEDRPLRLGGEVWRSAWLDSGVPHLVLLCDSLPDEETCRTVGKEGRELDLFPQGTNVTFAAPCGRGELQAVTYERGVEDLTESCGTGCVAAAAVAQKVLGMGDVIEVHNPGGTNRVFLREEAPLLMGTTKVVAKGELLEV